MQNLQKKIEIIVQTDQVLKKLNGGEDPKKVEALLTQNLQACYRQFDPEVVTNAKRYGFLLQEQIRLNDEICREGECLESEDEDWLLNYSYYEANNASIEGTEFEDYNRLSVKMDQVDQEAENISAHPSFDEIEFLEYLTTFSNNIISNYREMTRLKKNYQKNRKKFLDDINAAADTMELGTRFGSTNQFKVKFIGCNVLVFSKKIGPHSQGHESTPIILFPFDFGEEGVFDTLVFNKYHSFCRHAAFNMAAYNRALQDLEDRVVRLLEMGVPESVSQNETEILIRFFDKYHKTFFIDMIAQIEYYENNPSIKLSEIEKKIKRMVRFSETNCLNIRDKVIKRLEKISTPVATAIYYKVKEITDQMVAKNNKIMADYLDLIIKGLIMSKLSHVKAALLLGVEDAKEILI